MFTIAIGHNPKLSGKYSTAITQVFPFQRFNHINGVSEKIQRLSFFKRGL
jgi:hypothetical protein